MEILGIKVSDKFSDFYKVQTNKLSKPVLFNVIPESYGSPFGDSDIQPNWFVIGSRTSLKKDVFECNIAHELLHLVQKTAEGFPLTFNYIGSCVQELLGSELESLVLDLYVHDILKANGFDSTFFFNYRYNKLLNYFNNWDQVKHPLLKRALPIMYAKSTLEHQPTSSIPSNAEELAEIVQTATKIVSIINKTGYKTPGQAAIALCEINVLLDTWDCCKIQYKNCAILDEHDYKTKLASVRKKVWSNTVM